MTKSHTHIESWCPRSIYAVYPVWYMGYLNDVLVCEGPDRAKVAKELEAKR